MIGGLQEAQLLRCRPDKKNHSRAIAGKLLGRSELAQLPSG